MIKKENAGIYYGKLWALLTEKDLVANNVFKELGMSSQTLNSMRHGYAVSLKTIDKLCTYFKCQPSDIMEVSL